MFEKFLRTPSCMKVLSWLLVHADSEYSAAIIGIECDMVDMTEFMAVLSTLEGVELITTSELSEELMVKLNKDSTIYELLIHLKDEFNDIAFRSDTVPMSLSYLNSPQLKKMVDSEIVDKFEAQDLVDLCKNYKEIDSSDTMLSDIQEFCRKLDEKGELEKFIEELEKSIK